MKECLDLGELGLSRVYSTASRRHFPVSLTAARPMILVSADGKGLVSMRQVRLAGVRRGKLRRTTSPAARRPAPRTWWAATSAPLAQPPVGGGSDLRADRRRRVQLHRVRHRSVRTADRRLEGGRPPAISAYAGQPQIRTGRLNDSAARVAVGIDPKSVGASASRARTDGGADGTYVRSPRPLPGQLRRQVCRRLRTSTAIDIDGECSYV